MSDLAPNRRQSGLEKAAAAFLAPAQMADEIGRLGPYRVLKVLGKGGMGMVFKAEDPSLQRTVALKIMLPEIAKRGSAKERFLREARAAAAIEHEHIIPIFQVGEDRGIPFIAMSFLKGMNLDDWLKNKPPLSMPQILRIGREVAKGLQAAHDRGLIHRDIKPANLWLDAASKGRIKILDFGLARPEAVDSGLTRSGQIVGTPAYMSPEQAAGEKLDARSDLFSLGIVMYRLCAGQLPFRGNNVMAVLLALATQDPDPVASQNAEVPPALAALIGRLLSKNPQDRPASAKEVVEVIAIIERERMLQKFGAMPTQVSATFEKIASPGATSAGASMAFQFEESSDSFLSEQDFEVTRPSKTRSDDLPLRTPWLLTASLAGGLAVVLIFVGIAVLFSPAPHPLRDEGIVELSADGVQERVILERDGKIVATLEPSDRLAKLAPGRYSAKLPEGSKLRVESPNFTLDQGGVVAVRLLAPPVVPIRPVEPPKDPIKTPVAIVPPDAGPWRAVILDKGLTIEEGVPVLHFQGKGRTYSRDSFRDFHLRLDVRVIDVTKGGAGVHHFIGSTKGKGHGLGIHLGGLTNPKRIALMVQGWNSSFRVGTFQGGALIAQEQKISHLAPYNLPLFKEEPAGPWHRVEIVRRGDAYLYVVDGRIHGAVAGYRLDTDDGPAEPTSTALEFWSNGGESIFRNIEIRDITKIPPEILALGQPEKKTTPAPSKATLRVARPLGHWFRQIAYTPDGKSLAGAYETGSFHLMDPADPLTSRLSVLPFPKAGCLGVAVSADGRTAATSHKNGTIIFWELPSGKRRSEMTLPDAPDDYCYQIDFHPRMDLLLAGAVGGKIYQFDLTKKGPPEEIGQLTRNSSVRYSPDGKHWAMIGYESGIVHLDGKPLPPPPETKVPAVGTIAFSPDSRWLAAGSSRYKVSIWDVATRVKIRDLETKPAGVNAVGAFSPDGKILAFGGAGGLGKIILWDTTTWKEIDRVIPLDPGNEETGVQSVAFSPDGRTLVTSAYKTLKFWDLPAYAGAPEIRP